MIEMNERLDIPQYFDGKANRWINNYPELAGAEVLHQQGCYARVRQYFKGHHPKLGRLHQGYSGPETVVERDIIKPAGWIVTIPREGV